MIAGFVRGLSVRDVENTLADALGAEAALSKSTVSRVCQAIAEEFEAWSSRRMDELELDYLFLDASMFKMHPGARAEPVLAAWGITTEGAPVFVALAAGGSESTDAWGDFLNELQARGLRPPLLVISDGAAGLINAAESSLPRSLRQRCLIHRCRNLLAKVPAEAQRELRDAYWAIFDTDELIAGGMAPGPKLVAAVQHRIDAVADTYARTYPAAVKCLLADREQLTSYLRFPVEHHRRIRHSNFIERTFGETRRRVKVIGRLPGETSCLNLVWAVLDRASRGWRGMTMTPTGTRLLADLRHQLLDPPTPIRKPNKMCGQIRQSGCCDKQPDWRLRSGRRLAGRPGAADETGCMPSWPRPATSGGARSARTTVAAGGRTVCARSRIIPGTGRGICGPARSRAAAPRGGSWRPRR